MDVTDLVWIDSAGYHYEDYPSFLLWLTTSYQAIYGDDVYLGADSQDGQWLAVVAQALYDTSAVGSSIYNSFSPLTSQGAGLSRVVKINGIRRQSASHSTVELDIGGTAFTSITDGIAVDALEQQWVLPASVVIPISGTITVTATALDEGALAALPNTITGIFTPTLGWQTVNNQAAATVGTAVETDPVLRNRQSISTAKPAQTVFDASIGAVGDVAGVSAVKPYENYTDLTDANGLPPHSISLVVEGGTDDDIAQTILDYKTPGTNTYGTTSIPLVDKKGVPITISFFRPSIEPIAVKITLTPLASWITSNEDIISAAVAAYISAITIGGTIVLTKLYGVAYVLNTSAAGSFNIELIELAEPANGTITFSGNPSNADTLTVNGTLITFVTGTPSGSQVKIGASKEATAINLQAFLAASVNVNIILASYSLSIDVLTVTFKVPGPTGDTFTLTKSSSGISLSGAVLTGGAFASTDIDLLFDVLATCDPATNVSYVT